MPSTRRPPTHSRRVGNLLIRFLLATLLFTQLSSAQFFTANNDPDDEYFLVNGVFTFSVKNWYQAALNGEPYYGESFPWHDPARLASSSIHRKTTAPLAAAADEAAPVATTTITSTTTTTAPDVDLCIDLDDNVESKMDSTVDATMDISPNSNLGGHPATKALDKHGMDVTSFWGTALATMLFAAFLGALIMKRKRYVKVSVFPSQVRCQNGVGFRKGIWWSSEISSKRRK
ncbi:hypothetical protein DFJ77DRAFT_477765 [Powellomyces hirtus]|nr:hypothetical protein DFJ77DRAFT_477765 [Powellomyces hirtus]